MDLSILGLSSLGNDGEHFVHLGATSLQASLLNGHIRRDLDTDISRLTLYDHPTVAELAAIIENFRGCSSEPIRNKQEEWIEDTKIANDLLLPSVPVVDWRRDTEGRNSLTGATGLLEPFFFFFAGWPTSNARGPPGGLLGACFNAPDWFRAPEGSNGEVWSVGGAVCRQALCAVWELGRNLFGSGL